MDQAVTIWFLWYAVLGMAGMVTGNTVGEMVYEWQAWRRRWRCARAPQTLVRRRMYEGEVVGIDTPGYGDVEPMVEGEAMPGKVKELRRRGLTVWAHRYVEGPDGAIELHDEREPAAMMEWIMYPWQDVTIVGPPVPKKPKVIAELKIEIAPDLAKGLSPWQVRALEALEDKKRRSSTPPREREAAKPAGKLEDFVCTGRGGWRLRRLLWRLVWAVVLSGIGGGVWWWVR